MQACNLPLHVRCWRPTRLSQLQAMAAERGGGALQEQRSQVAGHKAAERAAHLAASPSAGKAAAKKKADSGRATRQKWDAEEVRMLEKALTKFPQGTAKRWDQVRSTPFTALTDPIRQGALEERGLCLTPCYCNMLLQSKAA